MDRALLKERELFKQRALITPAVEKKRKEPEKDVLRDDSLKKKPKASSAIAAPKLDIVSYKTMSGSSQYKFGVLAKIVKHMKVRHQEGDDHPLTLDEILDETNQLDIGSKIKQWLQTEALLNNPKIEVTSDGQFCFKATYKIKDKKSLLRLLKQQDLKGLGGILLEDIQESLPHSDKVMKNLQNEIIQVTRPQDKRKVIFYNDKTAKFPLHESNIKGWRSIAVDAMDEQKIGEHLEKQGIKSMTGNGPKRPAAIVRRKPNNKRKQFKKPRDNEHLADLLETYDEDRN